MLRLAMVHALGLAVACSAAAQDAPIDVPSGQPVTYYDSLLEEAGPDGPAVRFRFLAPQIARDAGKMPFVMAEADMAHLCETYALPLLPQFGPQTAQIVIVLMDRPVAFGAPAPEATQFFEAYRHEDGHCVWEGL